jgi:ABC-type phosphate/phosphonate transport system substrate-binding protein
MVAAEDPVAAGRKASASGAEISLVVMDPLAAPLSCPCVEGYAQRKYEKLAAFLAKQTGRKVRLTFAESLAQALKGKAAGRADIIIGKDSVVRSDAKKAKLTLKVAGRLTDKEGRTTQYGMIVVPKDDEARKVADLKGYRILFGPTDCQEKYDAPIALLKSAGVAIPKKIEVSAACSDGACKILEFGDDIRAAAVISSYAAPLLEGCGTIKKGDLRVVGKTAPVPFVTAFTTSSLSTEDRGVMAKSLLAVGEHPDLCIALETLVGFVPKDAAPVVAGSTAAAKKK